MEIKASLIDGMLVALELESEFEGEEEADHADEDEDHGEAHVTTEKAGSHDDEGGQEAPPRE